MCNVFIISAPSGSGKSTLVARLMAHVPRLRFSISYTTRAPRAGEREGEAYHFITKDEFETRVLRGEFLEHASVFGNYYGTHRSILDECTAAGCDLVLDIDVQGARQLKNTVPEAVSIFILAPSRDILEQRLRARSTDEEHVIARRLREAAEEIRNYMVYDYVLVNENLDESADTLAAIVKAERVRREKMEAKIRPILATFERGSYA